MVRKIINIITTVVLIFLIVIVVFLFVIRVSGSTPSLFGYSVFQVQTNSMEPELNPGDVILVKSCDPEDIQKGDIITYKATAGEMAGKTITHQVAVEPVQRGGEWFYRTKGIREGASLDPEISFDMIQGEFVRKLKVVDKLYSFFLSPVGLITFVGLIIVLFGYEMISLIVSYKAIDEKDDDYYAPPNRKPKKKRVKNKKTANKSKSKKASD